MRTRTYLNTQLVKHPTVCCWNSICSDVAKLQIVQISKKVASDNISINDIKEHLIASVVLQFKGPVCNIQKGSIDMKLNLKTNNKRVYIFS